MKIVKTSEDYRKFIVSSQDYLNCLNKVLRSQVEEMLNYGPYCISLYDGSMTRQPENLDQALAIYHSGAIFGNQSIILQFPRKDCTSAMDKFVYEKNGILRIKPEFALGCIDAKTNAVFLKSKEKK